MPDYHGITITNDTDSELSFIVRDSDGWSPHRDDYSDDRVHEHTVLMGGGEKTVQHAHNMIGGHRHTELGAIAALPGF